MAFLCAGDPLARSSRLPKRSCCRIRPLITTEREPRSSGVDASAIHGCPLDCVRTTLSTADLRGQLRDVARHANRRRQGRSAPSPSRDEAEVVAPPNAVGNLRPARRRTARRRPGPGTGAAPRTDPPRVTLRTASGRGSRTTPWPRSTRPPTHSAPVRGLDQVCRLAGLTGVRLDRRRDDVAHGAAIVARGPAHP